MSLDQDTNMHEVRTEDGGLRKKFNNKNVVDPKITLFSNDSSRAIKAPMVRSVVQSSDPLLLPKKQIKDKDYNVVRSRVKAHRVSKNKVTQSLPASRRDPESDMASNRRQSGPISVTGLSSEKRSSSTKLPVGSRTSSGRKPQTLQGSQGKLE